MKVLITGGAGFIGSNFTNFWVANHPTDDIVVFDKLTYAGNKKNLSEVFEKITFIKADICDQKAVDNEMEGVDILVHFAAETHVDRSIDDPDVFLKTNLLGTHSLLKSALKYKVGKFHHVSTDEVFGDLPLNSKEKWNENSPYKPSSPYSASKAASDHLVRAYHRTFGLPVTISNCSNNIGPNMYPEKFIPLAIKKLLNGENVPIYTPGNQIREWLNVQDHCKAIELILKHGRPGETYFISPDNPEITNLEVIKKLLKIMNLPEDRIDFVKDRPGHDQRYSMSHEKITKELGWKPMYDLDNSLNQMVEWYKTHE